MLGDHSDTTDNRGCSGIPLLGRADDPVASRSSKRAGKRGDRLHRRRVLDRRDCVQNSVHRAAGRRYVHQYFFNFRVGSSLMESLDDFGVGDQAEELVVVSVQVGQRPVDGDDPYTVLNSQQPGVLLFRNLLVQTPFLVRGFQSQHERPEGVVVSCP